MHVRQVYYSKKFINQFRALPALIQSLVEEKEMLFHENPLHPSLRLHVLHGELRGAWSISITMNYRIIFKRMPKGDILFISVGKHDIYRTS